MPDEDKLQRVLRCAYEIIDAQEAQTSGRSKSLGGAIIGELDWAAELQRELMEEPHETNGKLFGRGGLW